MGLGKYYVIILRIVGAALLILAQAMVAREYGAIITGKYFTIFSTMVIGSVISRKGIDTWAFQQLLKGKVNRDEIEEINSSALFHVIVNSFLFSVSIVIVILVFSKFNSQSSFLALHPFIIVFSIVCFSITMLISEILKALNYIISSMCLSGIIYPLLFLISIFLFKEEKFIYLAHGLSIFLSAVISIFYLKRVSFVKFFYKGGAPKSENIIALWANTLVHRALTPWFPILILGLFASDYEVGWFSVSIRISVLSSFFSIAIVSYYYSYILNISKDREYKFSLRFALKKSIFIQVILVTLITIGVLFSSSSIISYFGSEFELAKTTLPYLILAQAIFSFSIPFQYYYILDNNYNVILKSSILLGSSLLVLCSVSSMYKSIYLMSGSIMVSQFFYFSYLLFTYYSKHLKNAIQ